MAYSPPIESAKSARARIWAERYADKVPSGKRERAAYIKQVASDAGVTVRAVQRWFAPGSAKERRTPDSKRLSSEVKAKYDIPDTLSPAVARRTLRVIEREPPYKGQLAETVKTGYRSESDAYKAAINIVQGGGSRFEYASWCRLEVIKDGKTYNLKVTYVKEGWVTSSEISQLPPPTDTVEAWNRGLRQWRIDPDLAALAVAD